MHRLLVIGATALAGLVLSAPAGAWTWPADGAVLRPFGLGADPYAGGQHRGVDVAGVEGSAVRAPAAGTVTFAGSVPTHGRGITIQTETGHAVTLVHLGAIGVEKGAAVAEGAVVGTMGWSGTPEHPVPSVHLGIRRASEAEGYVDPLDLLPPRSTPGPAPPDPASPAVPVPTPAAPPAPVTTPVTPSAPAPVAPSPPHPAAPPTPATPATPATPPIPATASPPAPSSPAPGGGEAGRATVPDGAPTVAPGAASDPVRGDPPPVGLSTGGPVVASSSRDLVSGRDRPDVAVSTGLGAPTTVHGRAAAGAAPAPVAAPRRPGTAASTAVAHRPAEPAAGAAATRAAVGRSPASAVGDHVRAGSTGGPPVERPRRGGAAPAATPRAAKAPSPAVLGRLVEGDAVPVGSLLAAFVLGCVVAMRAARLRRAVGAGPTAHTVTPSERTRWGGPSIVARR